MVMRAGKTVSAKPLCKTQLAQTPKVIQSLLNVIYSDDEDIDDTLVLKSQVKKLYEAIEKSLRRGKKRCCKCAMALATASR